MLGTRWLEEHATLFGWMARRHDVDWSRTAGLSEALAVRHAVNVCLACREVKTCSEAFRRSGGEPESLEFCPNRLMFARWSRRPEPAV